MIELNYFSHETEMSLLKGKLLKNVLNLILSGVAIVLLPISLYCIPTEVDLKSSEIFNKVVLGLFYVVYIIMVCRVASFVFKTIKKGVLDLRMIMKVSKLDKQLSEAITSKDKNKEVELTLKIYDLMYELDVMSLERKTLRSIIQKYLINSIEILKFEFDTKDSRLHCDYTETGSPFVKKVSFPLSVRYVTNSEDIQTRLDQEQIILPYQKEYKEPINLIVVTLKYNKNNNRPII